MYKSKLKKYRQIIKQAYYQIKVALNPTDANAYYRLGQILVYQNKLPESVKYYYQAIENNPAQAADIYCLLCEILIKLNKFTEAVEVCQKSLELNSNNFKAHFYLGEALTKQNKFSEAVISLNQAIALNPEFSWSHYRLGVTLIKLNQFELAITYFNRAIELNPQFSWSYYHLGYIKKQQEQWRDAITAFEQHIELNPTYYYCYELLAQSIDELSSFGNSKEELTTTNLDFQQLSKKLVSVTHPHFSPPPVHITTTSKPNFMIIGQHKCGTTSLYSYLIQHPQILPSIKKEIHFWDQNHDRGLEWYLSHFPAISPNQACITGEGSTTYLDCPEIAQHIVKLFPNIKLIILLRNPVFRTISRYYMACRHCEENRSIEQAIFERLRTINHHPEIDIKQEHLDRIYFASSQYIELIDQWMKIFPQEQFLILKSEDLFSEPQNTMKQVFDFLGVKTYQLAEYTKANSASYPNISDQEKKALENYFQPYNQKLENYLGREFNWY